MSTFLEENEIRMIRYLLANASLEIKVHGAKTEPFSSNLGSPQGDGLSGKLFHIYFENALKEVREFLSGMEKTPTMMPDEAIYSDDAHFITQELEKKEKLQNNIKTHYKKEKPQSE